MFSTEFVAWWGAVIATLVLLWDIYKWAAEGPKLKMRIAPNMEVWGDPEREGHTWVSVNVSNVGDGSTTLKGIYAEWFPNWYSRLRRRNGKAATFPRPNDAKPLPTKVGPGEEWIGLLPQHDDDGRGFGLEDLAQSGHLLISVTQPYGRRAVQKRLIIGKKEPEGHA